MRFHLPKRLFDVAVICGLVFVASSYSQSKKPVPVKLRTITIKTKPDTVVWIDNVRFGTTDADGKLEIATVSAGAHTVRVRADGFKEKSQPLTAVQKGEVKIVLVKTTDQAELAFQEAERLASTDRDRSAEAYNRAIKLRPNYPIAYLGLARVLLDSGDTENAEKAITSVKKLHPAYAEATAVLGRIYKESGEEAKAIAAYKRAVTEGKGIQPEAFAGLGILYKEKAEGYGGAGDFENENASYTESAKDLRASLKQLSGAPDAIAIYQLLGLIYERQKKYNDAIAIYEEFLRFFPNSVEATAVRSFIVQLKKDMASQD